MRFGSTALALTTFAAVFIPKDLLPQSAEPSRILTNGNGEVTLAPDWATLALEATVEDSSALAAATASTAISQRILAALEAYGLSGDSVVRVTFSVGQRYGYVQDQGDKLRGYSARATVRVDVRELSHLAAIIDTALSVGATGVSGLRFRSDREEEARFEALRDAVAQAKADAEVLAEAAGGTLGPPLEIQTERARMPSFAFSELVAYARTGGPAAPELTVQDVIVFVEVRTEWALLTGR
jgi:uncharacterized protein YggE